MYYVEKRLRQRYKNAKFQFYTIPNAKHDYNEHEKQIAKLIIDSINKMI